MRNLFQFLWNHYFFFLFILFEVISLLLMVNSNYYQRSVVINSTNGFTGGILSGFSNISDYFSLVDANKILAEENATFYNKSPESYIKTDTTVFFYDDSLYHQQYEYIAVKVISNSINHRNNYLKLNKGQTHGLGTDMAVVAPNGIIGQIVEVSDNYSSVMSLLNVNTRVSAKLKSSNQVGSFAWDGNDYQYGTLSDIPSHVKIHIGDTVITSGYSQIYPEGLTIGYVEDFGIEKGDSFFKAKVKFAVDYNKIYYVNVIKNLMREEFLQLQKTEIQ